MSEEKYMTLKELWDDKDGRYALFEGGIGILAAVLAIALAQLNAPLYGVIAACTLCSISVSGMYYGGLQMKIRSLKNV